MRTDLEQTVHGQAADDIGSGATTRPRSPSLPRQVPYMLLAMRPQQWTKNGLILLAIVFAHRLTDAVAVQRVLLAFFAFSLAASTVYLVNDIADREKDRLHPRKRRRPIASGRLSVPLAVATATLTLAGAVALVYLLARFPSARGSDAFEQWGSSPLLFSLTLATYIGSNLLYSFWLKHLVLWDVFVIALGFVLRALAGALAIGVPISAWFYLCTTFLALFLALGKRRAELVALPEQAISHRQNLREYSVALLDQLLAVTVTCTLLTYSLYTFQGEGVSRGLILTIPIVVFGIFRYMFLIYNRQGGEEPDKMLYRDPQILGAVVLCVAVILAVLYGLPLLHAR